MKSYKQVVWMQLNFSMIQVFYFSFSALSYYLVICINVKGKCLPCSC